MRRNWDSCFCFYLYFFFLLDGIKSSLVVELSLADRWEVDTPLVSSIKVWLWHVSTVQLFFPHLFSCSRQIYFKKWANYWNLREYLIYLKRIFVLKKNKIKWPKIESFSIQILKITFRLWCKFSLENLVCSIVKTQKNVH